MQILLFCFLLTFASTFALIAETFGGFAVLKAGNLAKPYVNKAVDIAGKAMFGDNYDYIDGILDNAGGRMYCKLTA
jgi:hypothetical protein